jgi:hypothetical protein
MTHHYYSGTGKTCIYHDGETLCGATLESPIHVPGSVFSPGFGSSAEDAVMLALSELGFGRHAPTLAPLLRDALEHRGFEWTGGSARES